MSAESQKELELKFEMDVGELKALQSAATQSKELVGEPKQRRLRSIYFDTPTFKLRAAGIALRVRDDEGQWIQTVKAKTKVKAGVSNPIESECLLDSSKPVPAPISDLTLREELMRLSEEEILLPVFETVVERSSFRLRSLQGGEVELAVDVGHVYSDKGLDPIGEAELELMSGDADTLLHFASALFAGLHFRLGDKNKATRGYILIGAEDAVQPVPRSVKLPKLKKDQSIEQAFDLLVKAVIKSILHNWTVTQQGEDPEGPHQLRVGLRMFRSLLKAFRPHIDGPALRNLDRRARDVGRLVGQLRDLDVLIDEIYAPVAFASGKARAGQARLLGDRMRRYRRVVRSQVLDELQHWPYSSFMLELALFSRLKLWEPVAKDKADVKIEDLKSLSRLVLDRSYKRSKGWGKRLDELSLHERHSMRKSLKTLRYQGEIFGSLYGAGKNRRFTKRLKRLQTVFGYLNDVVMADRLGIVARDAGGFSLADRETIDRVLSLHEKRARKSWRKARKHWCSLQETDKFWR